MTKFKRRSLTAYLIRRVAVVIVALAITVLYFLILPLLETLARPPTKDLEVRQIDVADEPPPPPPPEVEEEQEEEQDNKPQLDSAPEPLDLSQVELALNPVSGGGLGSDFAIDLSKHSGPMTGAAAAISLSELDQKPRAIYQPNPRYPQELQKRGISGTVYVMFVVGENGRVQNIKVQKSTHKGFEKPVLDALKKWKFEPGRRKGKPVPFRMRIPITFTKS